MSFFEFPAGITYYRSKDPLENLKIKLTIKKVALATLWSEEAGFHDVSERQGEESCIFSWQEKIFSKRELLLYSDVKNCTSVREKAYHDQISTFSESEGKKHGQRIFCLVDADAGDLKIKPPLTNDPDLPETYFAGQVVQYRPRRPRIEDVNVLQRPNEKIVGKVSPSRRTGTLPSTRMHLMADLSTSPINPSEDSEYVLCTICIDIDGLIQMEPDFNALKKPYLVQAGKKSGEMYEYYIEHASEEMTRIDLERENQLFRALYQRHQDYNASLVGTYFSTPPVGVQRISLFGQIMDGEGFEYDHLFVHFLLDTPEGWNSKWDAGKEPSHFSTQIAMQQSDKKWHFGCPFAWLLESPTGSNDNDAWPQLLFEVVSLDSWNRYRVEGYGYLNIPILATSAFTTVVHTWRPVGNGIISQLRRFFIGGCPELDNLSYISIPSDFQGKELSRYGFRTAPSGKIRILLQTIRQSSERSPSNAPPASSKAKQSQVFGMDRAVEDILEAFKRARKRLLEARGILNVD